MFVAIDGLDGVGKTTLVKELAWHYGGVEMYTPGPGLRPVVDTVLASLGDHQTARCLFYAASVLACRTQSSGVGGYRAVRVYGPLLVVYYSVCACQRSIS